MGFVKTPEEIARLQAVMAAPKALDGEAIFAEFPLSEETVARLLPPGLECTDEPGGLANVGRWARSNAGAYAAASLWLKARHGELEGLYCLTMPISTEATILFGRDLLGEPKKLARISFERSGNRVRGSAERAGTTLLQLEGTLTTPGAPASEILHQFHYKYSHRSDGRGLDHDPLLIHNRIEHHVRHLELGTGTLRLESTAHDPLGDLGKVEPSYVGYVRCDSRATSTVLATVPADAFLPFAFSRLDDWTVLDNEERAGAVT